MGLLFAYIGQVFLANDAEVEFDVHEVTVLWDGQSRDIKADATGSTSLVVMLLLEGHSLTIEVESGDRVATQAKT